MGRILAIDYGKKRTGLAVTDVLKIIPGGLTTVETHRLLDYLRNYIQQEPVERFVVGWPVQPNGNPSENQPRVKGLIGQLRKLFPDIPVDTYDERFTSVMAHQTMIDSGLKRMRRRDKALVDEISATIILQSYMDRQSHL